MKGKYEKGKTGAASPSCHILLILYKGFGA
jgi:hypothetical protein